ncbi:hypothetical protein B0H15DRAFT_924040 [Mycena belliarum]|uniref:DUF6699 domain-containing protein n=1 Tax=Mycena belliarum TaxID=1033014 RepID=A0AAD6TYB8_9AGAR|nr:hypothetical protein B0H15DRAFT_924040 [Mycena belliae]
MSKTVHFSNTNIMYSPLPWSPSVASTSSLPSSPSEPSQPPLPLPESVVDLVSEPERKPTPEAPSHTPVIPAPAPLLYSPWPPSYLALPHLPAPPVPASAPNALRAQIHILLAFAPFAPPHVHYDLTQPLHTLNPQLTPAFLEPATFPPLTALTVLCRHVAWPLPVAPSHPRSFVAVLDVLTAVATGLRRAVQPAEYASLPVGARDVPGATRQGVDNAYFARCRLVRDEGERAIEARKGVKRVDFLMRRTRFLGLSGPLEGLHVWELNVA